jgi:hypothetical protein
LPSCNKDDLAAGIIYETATFSCGYPCVEAYR